MSPRDPQPIRQCILDAAPSAVPGEAHGAEPGPCATPCANAPSDSACRNPARSPAGNGGRDDYVRQGTGWRNVQPTRHDPGGSATSPSSICGPSRARLTTRSFPIAYISLINTSTTSATGSIPGAPHRNSLARASHHHPAIHACPYVVKIHKNCGASSAPPGSLRRRTWTICPRPPKPMLSMIEWWICLSCHPRMEKARAPRTQSGAEGVSVARRIPASFSEGVSVEVEEVLFRAVRRALTWAMAMTSRGEGRAHQLCCQ